MRNKKATSLALALIMLACSGLASGAQKKSRQSSKAKVSSKKLSKAQPAIPAEQAPASTASVPQEVERITVEQLKEKIDKNEPVFIIDSRSTGSYDGSDYKIKGSVRIPENEIEARLAEIPRDKPIVIYCT
ncbi:MAG TPA: rhodanese-like domain-containing protein [Blastocatellia bacterium]|jgi:hypothetical protein